MVYLFVITMKDHIDSKTKNALRAPKFKTLSISSKRGGTSLSLYWVLEPDARCLMGKRYVGLGLGI